MRTIFQRAFVVAIACVATLSASGCVCTRAVQQIGMERAKLSPRSFRVQADGSVAIAAQLKRDPAYLPSSRHLRYVFVPAETVQSQIREHLAREDERERKQREFAKKHGRTYRAPIDSNNVRLFVQIGEEGSEAYPAGVARRDATTDDLPSVAISWPQSETASGQREGYSCDGREVELLVGGISLQPDQARMVHGIHYPAQLLLPISIVVDVVTFPIQLIWISAKIPN